jgi:hypothetical protein
MIDGVADRPAGTSFWSILGSCAATLGVALAVFAGVGGLTMGPVDSELIALHRQIDRIDVTMAPLLTLYAQHKSDEDRFTSFQIQIDQKLDKNVFEMSRTSIADRIGELVATDNKAMDEALHQVHDLEGKIVSREENVVHWNATDALALRVNTLADKLGSCATK